MGKFLILEKGEFTRPWGGHFHATFQPDLSDREARIKACVWFERLVSMSPVQTVQGSKAR